MKAQHLGALTPLGIVRRNPQVPHTAREVTCHPVNMKAQHEGALPPPCIVRKDPRVPHTARRGACVNSETCLASSVGEGGGPVLTALESSILLSGTLVLRQPQGLKGGAHGSDGGHVTGCDLVTLGKYIAGGRLLPGAAAALGSPVRGEGREGSWTRRRFMGLSGEQVPPRAAHCLAGLTMGLPQPQGRPPPRPEAFPARLRIYRQTSLSPTLSLCWVVAEHGRLALPLVCEPNTIFHWAMHCCSSSRVMRVQPGHICGVMLCLCSRNVLRSRLIPFFIYFFT